MFDSLANLKQNLRSNYVSIGFVLLYILYIIYIYLIYIYMNMYIYIYIYILVCCVIYVASIFPQGYPTLEIEFLQIQQV